MHRISDQIKDIVITGKLVPFYDNGQPVMMEFGDSEDKFVFIFSDMEKLREAMVDISYDSVKQIDDGPEFVRSVLPQARIALDPWKTDQGTTRWTEVLPGD